MHYLYVAAPVAFTQADCAPFRAYLEDQLAITEPVIHSVQMTMRENLYEFQGNQQSPYLKITVTNPKSIVTVRSTIMSGSANYKGMWKGIEGEILTFDNIQYLLRFMIDTGVKMFPILYFSTQQANLYYKTDLGHVMG